MGRLIDSRINRSIIYGTGMFFLFLVSFQTAEAQQTVALTVSNQDTSGNDLSGYFVVLFKNGNPISTGFTTVIFPVNDGETYSVQVQDYGNYVFDHWLDTGSTSRDRDLNLSENSFLTAVYRNITAPPPTGMSKLIVNTVNTSGVDIIGYYTTLWQNGLLLEAGFSPYSFNVNTGEMYQVAVSDYGNMFYNIWDDASTNPFRSFSLTSDSAFTAVYQQSTDLLVSLTGQPTDEFNTYFDDTWPQVKYTMTVLNNSPNTAENVLVKFVPNQFGLDSNIATSDISLSFKCRNGPYAYPPDCIVENLLPGECLTYHYLWGMTSWTCNLGDMVEGQTINFSTIVFNVGPSPRTVTGTTTVSSDTDDHDLSNNVATLTVEDPL